jgi:hypothetical protein
MTILLLTVGTIYALLIFINLYLLATAPTINENDNENRTN